MSFAKPLVSIITPVYNGAKYIGELIESIAAQDYPYIEHLIIDDGSDDAGATVAILAQYPHLRWWSRANKGQYPTMNEGLDAAEGEIVCFISADDLMTPGTARAIVDEFRAHPELDGVYGKMLWMNADGSLRRSQEIISRGPLWFHRYKTFISHCSLYMKKEALLHYDLYFDTALRLTGDLDWIIRITDAPLKIGYVNKVLSKVRSHPTQASQQNTPAMQAESRIVYQRHGVNQLWVKITLTIFHGIMLLRNLWVGWRAGGLQEIKAMFAAKLKRNTG